MRVRVRMICLRVVLRPWASRILKIVLIGRYVFVVMQQWMASWNCEGRVVCT